MAYPIFSWLPHQDGTSSPIRQYIELSEYLSDLQVTPQRDVSDTYAISGGVTRTMTRAWLNVRITLDRFSDRAVFRDLTNMINHLERGGTVSFCNDKNKAYAARLDAAGISTGGTKIGAGENLYKKYSTTAVDFLQINDEVVVENEPPFAVRAIKKIAGKTEFDTGAASYTVDAAFTEAHREGAFIRYADFWPCLYLPKSQINSGVLTHDHRINYTLDINLQYIIPYDNTKSVPQGL